MKHVCLGESRLGGGPLAQLVEQRTFNPWVVGSSPTGPTWLGGEVELLPQHLDVPRCLYVVEGVLQHTVLINNKG